MTQPVAVHADAKADLALVREALSMAHRIGKEAFWIRELARKLARGANGEDARHLVQLAEHVMEASRAFTEMATRNEVRFRDNTSLAQAVESARRSLQAGRARTLPLSLRLSPAAARTRVDRAMKDVLIDLLENALAASDEGVQVEMEASREEGELRIRVIDHGRGMPGPVLRDCRRLGFTTRRADGGTGVGLAVADAAVRAVRGRLEIRSREGEGTRVEVQIPV